MDRLQSRMNELNRADHRVWDKREASLYDKVNLLTADGFSAASLKEDAFLRRYRALSAADPSARSADAGPSSAPIRKAAEEEIEKQLLCRLLARKAEGGKKSDLLIRALLFSDLTEAEEPSSLPEGNRAVYLRNSYADQAYRRFASVVPELRADYASSFAAACEAVYYGRAGLCILPLENNTGGALIGFRNLIMRHELRIACTCDVLTGEDEVTRFALLKKSLSPIPKQKKGTGERFFRFVLLPSEQISLRAVLSAAENFGLPLYKTDATPISYTDNDFSYDITLHAEGDLAAFLVYLTLETPGAELVGFYSNLPLSSAAE